MKTICRNCRKPIEKSEGALLYPFTHVDPDQNDCLVAEPLQEAIADLVEQINGH